MRTRELVAKINSSIKPHKLTPAEVKALIESRKTGTTFTIVRRGN